MATTFLISQNELVIKYVRYSHPLSHNQLHSTSMLSQNELVITHPISQNEFGNTLPISLNKLDTTHPISQEEFEDTKEVIRIRKSKRDRQHNGQKIPKR